MEYTPLKQQLPPTRCISNRTLRVATAHTLNGNFISKIGLIITETQRLNNALIVGELSMSIKLLAYFLLRNSKCNGHSSFFYTYC
jgi:hypothetical protein